MNEFSSSDPFLCFADRVLKISKESLDCQIIPVSNLPFDLQMIIEPKEIKTMTAKTFFFGPDPSPKLTYTKFVRRFHYNVPKDCFRLIL